MNIGKPGSEGPLRPEQPSPYKLERGSGRTLEPPGAQLIIAEWTAPGTPEGAAPEWIAPLHLHREDD